MPELEKRKKVLEEKRKNFKPIDPTEIKEHMKKHDEDLKLKNLQQRSK
jgi:hypothetical protein